jgi:hypothetical protein
MLSPSVELGVERELNLGDIDVLRDLGKGKPLVSQVRSVLCVR